MPFNTLTVATAVTPSVIETYFSHFLHRAPLRQKPTAHISYHEGLRLIRQFLDYASRHSVEDLQAFTAQWVPAPTWVRIQDSEIAPQFLKRAAEILVDQLGRRGIERVGGPTWWQWRRPETPLRAEWIEMKKDYNERKRAGVRCDRVILYIHGGAYYFGSVDEHRYQMQRHARKLKARVLAPRYRLAPQFPFPCGLFDCIASYLYLLEHFPPSQILFAGDSAGGGMVLSLLVVLRDQGCPLPAGTMLLSPWVDLTHSFPSVAGDGSGDYIPPHGFLHRPSMAWPPPSTDEVKQVARSFERPIDAVELPANTGPDMRKSKRRKADGENEEDGDNEDDEGTARPGSNKAEEKKNKSPSSNPVPGPGQNLSVVLDDQTIEIKEQIQLYASNDLLAYPLVSPVMQPSLGGLPPMLIQVGGGELLCDEQVYLAHKAANPKAYPPSASVMDEYDPRREALDRYPPTDVQLQVWDDLCHVPHTLSFTRPAKYMYRSVAQFGAWALAHAQHKGIDIQDDDAVSVISSGPDTADEKSGSTTDLRRKKTNGAEFGNDEATGKEKAMPAGAVGRAGEPLPAFKDHMVRQRVTRHGMIYPLALPSEIACLHLDPATIGRIKPGPVRKWLAAKKVNDQKFANERKKVQKKKAKEGARGYDRIRGETPPATALINRRRNGVAPEEKKKGKSWGLAMWSGWGSHHDESTLEREGKIEQDGAVGAVAEQTVKPTAENAPPSNTLAIPVDPNEKRSRRTSGASILSAAWSHRDKDSRPKSPYKKVTDAGQVGGESPMAGSSMRSPLSRRSSGTPSVVSSRPASIHAPIPVLAADRAVPTTAALAPDSAPVPGSENTYLSPGNQRPHNGVSAYPFKLRGPALASKNPSMLTLDSVVTESPAAAEPVELPTPSDHAAPVSELGPSHRGAAEQAAGRVVVEPASPADSISTRNPPVFDQRTSVLGRIGADGMPTAPLVARGNDGNDGEVGAQQKKDAAREAVDSAEQTKSTSAVPFKVRNPVFDARDTKASPSDLPPTASPAAAKPATTMDTPPFKIRHTVYDPKLTMLGTRPQASPPSPLTPAPHDPAPTVPAKRDSPSSTTPSPPAPTPDDARAAPDPPLTALPSMPNPTPPPSASLPRNPPTVRAATPPGRAETPPPPPPPKDEKHLVLAGAGAGAGTPGKAGPPTSHTLGLLSSKFSTTPAPYIGALPFQTEQAGGGGGAMAGAGAETRPPLDTFFTASEGGELWRGAGESGGGGSERRAAS